MEKTYSHLSSSEEMNFSPEKHGARPMIAKPARPWAFSTDGELGTSTRDLSDDDDDDDD